jgi:hypothetical protein
MASDLLSLSDIRRQRQYQGIIPMFDDPIAWQAQKAEKITAPLF